MNTSVVADERVSPDEKAAAKRSIAPKEKVAATGIWKEVLWIGEAGSKEKRRAQEPAEHAGY